MNKEIFSLEIFSTCGPRSQKLNDAKLQNEGEKKSAVPYVTRCQIIFKILKCEPNLYANFM